MALDILKETGTPLDKQQFDWREIVGAPISKLNDDAFTRVRVILMNGLEQDANRLLHAFNRTHGEYRLEMAQIRRAEHHQQTLINWLLPADQSPLETTIAYEQVAIEVTASLAINEPDPYIKQVLDFGLLEDFDHMYRYAALMDRLEGKDANNILQCYTDICPGRPTIVEHRAPQDDLRDHYNKRTASPITKLNAITIVAGEFQTRDYYMTIGPMFADPVARQLYAEIASIEEQHVTQYESIIDPSETWLEKWLLHEAAEVYNYHSCMIQEQNPHVRRVWERFVDYELGHLHFVMDLFRRVEKRDPEEVLPHNLPEPINYSSHRDYVRDVLTRDVALRARGTQFVPEGQESPETLTYRERLNQRGSPSQTVAAGYMWTPGTEIAQRSAVPTRAK